MSTSVRFVAWCLLFVISILSPFPFFLFCAFMYVFFWNGYELFIITALIDSTFGTSELSFLYTLSLAALLIVGTLLRPYLSWYTTPT